MTDLKNLRFQRLYAEMNENIMSEDGRRGGASDSYWEILYNIGVSETTKALMAPTWPNAPEMDGNPNHYVKVLSSFCLLPFHEGTRTFREMLSALNVTRYSKFSSVFPPEIILWH